MSQLSVISGLQMWMRAPKTEIQQILPLTMMTAEELWGKARSSHLPLLKVNKERDLAPESWEANEMNDFSEPRGLHLPTHRMLNSLTWYLILMFILPAVFVINLYVAQFFLPPSWSSFLRATEMLSLHIAHKFFSRALDVTLHPWRKIPPLKKRNGIADIWVVGILNGEDVRRCKEVKLEKNDLHNYVDLKSAKTVW